GGPDCVLRDTKIKSKPGAPGISLISQELPEPCPLFRFAPFGRLRSYFSPSVCNGVRSKLSKTTANKAAAMSITTATIASTQADSGMKSPNSSARNHHQPSPPPAEA